MGAHWWDTSFLLQALNVCVSCAASSNEQSCVLNGLHFLDVNVRYDRTPYGVCVFQYRRMIASNVDLISSFCLTHLFEVSV